MGKSEDAPGWSGRWIAFLLRLFPGRFRQEFGGDMLNAFLDQRDDAVHAAGNAPWRKSTIAIATVRTSWQLLRAGLAERLSAHAPRQPRHPKPRTEAVLETVLSDLKYAMRGLSKSPGFTAISLITLALGVGATTAIFSVVNGVLLKPLPYHEPDDLVGVWHNVPGRGDGNYPLSPGTYFTYREENRVFDDVGLWRPTAVTVTGLDEPERVMLIQVSDGTFPTLGIEPILGRRFSAEDDERGASPTVVLGNSYWRGRFGADSGVIGRTLLLNGAAYEIIGVMPPDFRLLGNDAAVYITFRFDRTRITAGNFSFRGLARLRPGVTLAEADRDITRMLPLAPELFPGGMTAARMQDAGFGPDVHPLRVDEIGNIEAVLWVLFGTVGLVLAIACINVANLFLVRAETRQREIAVRVALGAARTRLARQFLTESLVLGMMGGVMGLGLAYGGLRLLVQLAPETLPRVDEIAITPVVLLFTFAVAIVAGLVFGIFPLMRFGTPDTANALKAGSRGTSDGRERHRLRNVLAGSEVALALILLIGSGLMVRSFQALRQVHPGFDRPEQVLTMRLSIPSRELPETEAAALMHERILERIGALPEVISVGASSSITMDGLTSNNGVHVEDFPTPADQLAPLRRYKWVAGDYFAAMGNPIVAGRAITWEDVRNRAAVVVVSENFAREYWGEPNGAIGRRIRDGGTDLWYEIVGVVGDVRDDGIDKEAPTVAFWPFVMPEFWGDTPYVWRALSYAIRAGHSDPTALLSRVREVVWSVNRNLPLANVQTLDEILARSMARTSFTLVMLGIAAMVALLLGMVGIYGVISYVVAQRTREIGIRVALGAQHGNVRMLVLRQGGLVALVGVAVGLGAAVGLTRFMDALLYGVSAADPMTYGVAALTVVIVALLASYVPARRAAAIDPVQALQSE